MLFMCFYQFCVLLVFTFVFCIKNPLIKIKRYKYLNILTLGPSPDGANSCEKVSRPRRIPHSESAHRTATGEVLFISSLSVKRVYRDVKRRVKSSRSRKIGTNKIIEFSSLIGGYDLTAFSFKR